MVNSTKVRLASIMSLKELNLVELQGRALSLKKRVLEKIVDFCGEFPQQASALELAREILGNLAELSPEEIRAEVC